MIQEYPVYYKEFKCIGGSCPDSCCIGWELDIDEYSYEYYCSVEGEFGDRLKSVISDEDKSFRLKEDGRCPMLNDENLCDIYAKLGEQGLCAVCTEYPRYYMTIGDYEQADIGMSCHEVSRLIFSDERPILYGHRNVKVIAGDVIDRTSKKKLNILLLIRDSLIGYMQNDLNKEISKRTLTWQDKTDTLPAVIDELQSMWNNADYKGIRKLCRQLKKNKCPEVISDKAASDGALSAGMIHSNHEIISVLKGVEFISREWMDSVVSYEKLYDEKMWGRFEDYCRSNLKQYDAWHCRIVSYFLFRYIIRAYYDNMLISKIMFAVFSAKAIHCLDYVRWISNDCQYTNNDRIEVAARYAKEIEHSDDNMEYLDI